eukprot:6204563-Pleurochrysis_carterae.AAC.1
MPRPAPIRRRGSASMRTSASMHCLYAAAEIMLSYVATRRPSFRTYAPTRTLALRNPSKCTLPDLPATHRDTVLNTAHTAMRRMSHSARRQRARACPRLRCARTITCMTVLSR